MESLSIDTQNLTIRRFRRGDLPAFTALIRDKMAAPYSAYDDQFPTDDARLRGILWYFADSDEVFAITLGDTLIGYITLNRVDEHTRNLGYCLHSAYRGKGYGTEAVSAILTYAGHVVGLQKLTAGTAEANIPSVRLLLKMGFTETGREQGSFVSDEDGNPVTFTGISFERIL